MTSYKNIKGTTILPSINNDNNTSRLMRVNNLYTDKILNGGTIIMDGYVTGLINPVNDNEIATKYYVDNLNITAQASGPDKSIQYNNAGVFDGNNDLTISDPNTLSETLNINGIITNNVINIDTGKIENLSDPINNDEAATKKYVDSSINIFESINLTEEQLLATEYTPEQIYNKILNINISPNNIEAACLPSVYPIAEDMAEYLGNEFVIGKSWTTIFKYSNSNNELQVKGILGPEPIPSLYPSSFIFFGIPLPAVITPNYTVITIKCVVTNDTIGTERYVAYITSYNIDINTNAQITDRGILTPSLITSTNNTSLIYPIPSNPDINSITSVTYTYEDLRNYFIIRTGLTSDTNDTFEIASDFIQHQDFDMGGGTFKFFIQNPTLYNLTLNTNTGWTFSTGNSNIIPSLHCGAFWVTVTISPPSCKIYTISINPING